MRDRVNHLVHAAVLYTLLGVGDAAMAAGDSSDIALDTVEVNAILPEKLEAVPGAFDVISEEELDTRHPLLLFGVEYEI